MRHRAALLAVSVAAVAALAGTGAQPAAAGTLACGDVITTDTTLSADLLDCPGAGLVIGADDVTLDLADHTISGTVVHGASCGPVHGIDDTGGFDGLTVENGTVEGFDDGVELIGATDSSVKHLAVEANNCDGVFVSDGSHGTNVSSSSATLNDFRGIVVRDSNDVRVAHNTVRANDHSGISAFRSRSLRIKGNSVSGKGRTHGGRAEFGIELVTGSTTRVVRNEVAKHRQVGIILFDGSRRNVIAHNSVELSLLNGIFLEGGSNRNVVGGNEVSDTFADRAFGGIEVLESSANRIRSNTVEGNVFGGVVIGGVSEVPGASAHNVVAGNAVCRNPDDGIILGPDAAHTRAVRNNACENGDDGIQAAPASGALGANEADDNADLGIEAVGVGDLGGNRAAGNGDPQQCTGVACS